MRSDDGAWREVWQLVRQIPPGRVMSYGQIARLLSRPLTPRAVGWAMRACPEDVPWHRIVAADGRCSADRGKPWGRQRRRLEAEGVRFTADGRVDMARHGWGSTPERAADGL